jgi:hypothetical protein
MQALSTQYNDEPKSASRAFDNDRDGFVFGAGGGIVVLESLEHAKARGAKIYGEVQPAASPNALAHGRHACAREQWPWVHARVRRRVTRGCCGVVACATMVARCQVTGYAATGDGYDMVAPSGEGSERAMKMAMDMADEVGGKKPIDYINTHGTSTPVRAAPTQREAGPNEASRRGRPSVAPPPRVTQMLDAGRCARRGCVPLTSMHVPARMLTARASFTHARGLTIVAYSQVGDAMELQAVKRRFEGLDYKPHVGSTKSLTGHVRCLRHHRMHGRFDKLRQTSRADVHASSCRVEQSAEPLCLAVRVLEWAMRACVCVFVRGRRSARQACRRRSTR